MRIATNLVLNGYLIRGFIALAIVLCRVKLGELVPRGVRRR